jgi:gluconokinase
VARMTIAVMMGVSGSGKTVIAQGVAARLGWHMLEGDKFHPPANVQKMSKGIPLDDSDRLPWLEAIAAAIDRMLAEGLPAAIACSALKRKYRDILIGKRQDVVLVYLKGSEELIGQRMANRAAHFMPASLLASQFATLEEPNPDEHPIIVDVAAPSAAIVSAVIKTMQERGLLR